MPKSDIIIPMPGKQKLIKKRKKKNELDFIYKSDKDIPAHSHIFVDGSREYSGVILRNEVTGEKLADCKLMNIEVNFMQTDLISLSKLSKKSILPLTTLLDNFTEPLERVVRQGLDLPESILKFEEFDDSDWCTGLIVLEGKLLYIQKAEKISGFGPIEIKQIVYFGKELDGLFGKIPEKVIAVLINLLSKNNN